MFQNLTIVSHWNFLGTCYTTEIVVCKEGTELCHLQRKIQLNETFHRKNAVLMLSFFNLRKRLWEYTTWTERFIYCWFYEQR